MKFTSMVVIDRAASRLRRTDMSGVDTCCIDKRSDAELLDRGH